jgi:RNA polymerase sigma-70 factor, ECF subfamily
MSRSVERAPASAEGDRVFHEHLVAIIPQLRSFARGLCGNRDLADDLAQDALTRAWAARQSFEPGTNFRAWMFMILRNQFYTTIKKNARIVLAEPEFIERALTVEPAQQDRINVADVSAALQKLPSQQRAALMLIGANEVSYEEAADIMGCAIGTVKSRVARARSALALLVAGPVEIDVSQKRVRAMQKRTSMSKAA